MMELSWFKTAAWPVPFWVLVNNPGDAAATSRLPPRQPHPSIRKTGESVAVALPKGLIDRFRSDQPGKIARDGYVAEAVERIRFENIAGFQMRDRSGRAVDVFDGVDGGLVMNGP